MTSLSLAIVAGLRLVINVYTGIVFIYVLMSWISQGGYNPSMLMISTVLRELADPILAPVRRFIPPIGGFDLTPIFVLIGLQAIAQMLVSPAVQLARPYVCQLGAMI